MKLEEKLIEGLRSGSEYVLGQPWKAKESLVAVVPVLLKGKTGRRDYILIEETKLEAKDTGEIGSLRIERKDGKTIFIRSGAIFKGVGTQSRAIEKSVVMEAKEIEVPVRCVHLSHGISAGARLSYAGSAPLSVHSALYTGSQHAVWANVAGLSSSLGSGGGLGQTDSLVEIQESLSKEMDKFIKEVPCFENQVGVFVIDEKGALGLELFDHPDSWKAVSESVLLKYGEAFMRPAKTVFEVVLSKARVKGVFDSFLDEITEAELSQVDGHTTILKGKVDGEFTVLNHGVIHLLALRHEEKSKDEDERNRGYVETFMQNTYPQGNWGRRRTHSRAGAAPASPASIYFMATPSSYSPPSRTFPPAPKRNLLIKDWDEKVLSSIDALAGKEMHTKSRSAVIKKLARERLEEKGYLEGQER